MFAEFEEAAEPVDDGVNEAADFDALVSVTERDVADDQVTPG